MMKPSRCSRLLGMGLLALSLQSGCSDDDSGTGAASPRNRPWLAEAEFTNDSTLEATQSQVVVLDLEASSPGSPNLVLNTIRQEVPEATQLRLCVDGDDPYVRQVAIQAGTGETLAVATPGDECADVTLAAGSYRLHVTHDGSEIGSRPEKAFVRRLQGPELQSTEPGTFVVPDFMAFRGTPSRYFVTSSDGSPSRCLVPTTTTVDTHAVFRLTGGPSAYSLSDGTGAAVAVRPNCSVLGFLCTTDSLATVVPTFEFNDQGDWQFTMTEKDVPCDEDLPVVAGPELSYVRTAGQQPTKFTADYKGYDCRTPCDANGLSLEQGEVALFTECGFQGRAIVFNADVRDFSIYDAAATAGLAIGDDMVSSVRVGPKTLAYFYEDAKFSGTSVAVGLDAACLDGTALGSGAASSMHVNQIDVTQLIVSTKKCENCIVPGIDLSGDDLSGGDFAGARFAGGNLTGTIFTRANLDRSDMSADTILKDTDFSGASLACADFNSADLTKAIFDEAIELTTDFSCRLNTADSMLNASTIPVDLWRYLDLNGATIINDSDSKTLTLSTLAAPVDLSGALLNGVVGLQGVILDGADMGCATPGEASANCTQLLNTALNEASLRQVTLTDAAMNGAHLIHANLAGADLSGAQLLKSPTTLLSANLTGANLKNANLAAADLSGVTLANANWHSSSAGSCSPGTWTGMCATGQGATLSNADLSGAYLNGLDLSGATAQGTKLTGAMLVGANLTGANLSGDPNTGASTTLAGAFLQGAEFTDANTSGADFTSAYVDVSSTSGGLLIWELPQANVEFTGYTAPSMGPECPLFVYSQQTQVQTISGNVCPDGNNGTNGGRCSDAQWQSPLTPIDAATPPASTDISVLPAQCKAIDFGF